MKTVKPALKVTKWTFHSVHFNREQRLQVCLSLTSQNFMIMSSRTEEQKAKSKLPANVMMNIFLFFVFMIIKKQAGSLIFSLEDMGSMIV